MGPSGLLLHALRQDLLRLRDIFFVHEMLGLAPDHFIRRIPENIPDGGIAERVAAVRIDSPDPLLARGDDRLESRLARTQRLFHRPALGDVPGYAINTDNPAVGAANRPHPIFQPDRMAILVVIFHVDGYQAVGVGIFRPVFLQFPGECLDNPCIGLRGHHVRQVLFRPFFRGVTQDSQGRWTHIGGSHVHIQNPDRVHHPIQQETLFRLTFTTRTLGLLRLDQFLLEQPDSLFQILVGRFFGHGE